MGAESDTTTDLCDDDVCPIPECDVQAQPLYLHYHFHVDHSEYEWLYALTRFLEDPNKQSEYVDDDIADAEGLFEPEIYDEHIKSALNNHPVFSEDLAISMFGSLVDVISSAAKQYVDDGYDPDFHDYHLSRYKNRKKDAIKELAHDTYGSDWGEIKWSILQRDGFACRLCNGSVVKANMGSPHNKHLDVHHITPAREFESQDEMNDPSNLITLCRSCHGTHEGEHTDATADEWPALVRNEDQVIEASD